MYMVDYFITIRVGSMKRFLSVLIFSILITSVIHGFTGPVGSDSDVGAAQSHIEFTAASNNEIRTYALMQNGFSFASGSVTCTLKTILPVSGTVDLNGGTISLQNDLSFSNVANLVEFGSVYGNSHKIELSKSISLLSFGCSRGSGGGSGEFVTEYKDRAELPEFYYHFHVNGVDWAYDKYNGTYYVAAATDEGCDELNIMSFDGSSLGLAQHRNQNCNDLFVRWHPSTYYLASLNCCDSSADDLQTYLFTAPSTLTLKDTEDVNNCWTAVAWHPSGNYLAAGGQKDDPDVYVFDFNSSTGALSNAKSVDIYCYNDVSRNALAWESNGEYLAVGKESGASKELSIVYFNGSSLTVAYQGDFNSTVKALDWLNDSYILAVGFKGGSETNKLRLYEYNTTTSTITLKESIAETADVNSVYWCNNKEYLLVAAGTNVKIYYYNSGDHSLTLVDTVASQNGKQINEARFSHDGYYFAFGEENSSNYNFYVYSSQKPEGGGGESDCCILDDTILAFDADLTVSGCVTVHGECVIQGGGRILTLDENLDMYVAPGAQLSFENLTLKGLKEENILCLANNSSIVFKNTEICLADDYNFTTGSMRFEQDVKVTGSYIFSYESAVTSTIAEKAVLMFDHGTTFSYAPSIANRDLLYMPDDSAWLYLNGASVISTSTALRLTRGSVYLDNHVTFTSTGIALDEIISFGDGSQSSNDIQVTLLSAADVEVYGGLHYNNVNC